MFIITVKMPKNPDHDPKNKVTGKCPVGLGICTDSTGEHHSYLDMESRTIEEAHDNAVSLGADHITRIEQISPVS